MALVTDDILTAEYTVNFKKTHSQTLLPMLDEIVKMLGLDLETIDAIAAAGGPGSFTGLRIGADTAKGLGLALKKPLIHVPTICGGHPVLSALLWTQKGARYIQDCTTWKMELRRLWSSALWIWEN